MLSVDHATKGLNVEIFGPTYRRGDRPATSRSGVGAVAPPGRGATARSLTATRQRGS